MTDTVEGRKVSVEILDLPPGYYMVGDRRESTSGTPRGER